MIEFNNKKIMNPCELSKIAAYRDFSDDCAREDFCTSKMIDFR